VVDAINGLTLPRYGLGNYVQPRPDKPPTTAEKRVIEDLSRAGKRLMGFCRTNLFKRLESSGQAFIQSVERHILRNYIYLHALENGLAVPVGTQDAGVLDARITDDDSGLFTSDDDDDGGGSGPVARLRTEKDFEQQAEYVYSQYQGPLKRRFRWLPADFFTAQLTEHIQEDVAILLGVLRACGDWDAARDAKLAKLYDLIARKHPGQKVIVFSQFADSVYYIFEELQKRGVGDLAAVTGDTEDPTRLAWRFSPDCNGKRDEIPSQEEIDVLIATDVLSEGQNLQDGAIVVNVDLPWAIIRLIQRAGRVDRIGQKAEEILCYTFLPADGVNRIIRLRERVRQRLAEADEVLGTDGTFFEDATNRPLVHDLYHEKAGILDGDDDTEVDLGSFAFQIWKNAIDRDPALQKIIPDLPPVIFSTKGHNSAPGQPEGILAYVRTSEGSDALAWLDKTGCAVTESQFTILKAAECEPDCPQLPRHPNHHELVREAVKLIAKEEKTVGGQLGRPSGARFRTYERLKRFADDVKGTLFDTAQLRRAVEDIYNYPLRQVATDTLNRQLRSGISDEDLASRLIELREEGRLCIINDEDESQEPRIICSLGLRAGD
jgi:hypothetical protein